MPRGGAHLPCAQLMLRPETEDADLLSRLTHSAVRVIVLLLVYRVTLGKLGNFCQPQFACLQKEDS